MGGRDPELGEAQTVLSTPAAFREAFCQHWLESEAWAGAAEPASVDANI